MPTTMAVGPGTVVLVGVCVVLSAAIVFAALSVRMPRLLGLARRAARRSDTAAVARGLGRFGRGARAQELARREQDLADREQALARKTAELDDRVHAAERAERLRNLLLAKLSHDVRTPLNSVITLSHLLSDGAAGSLSDEQERCVAVIHRSGRTLLSLMNEILDLAALESRRAELDIGTVDVGAMLEKVAELTATVARSKGLAVHVDTAPHLIAARTDEERIRRVLVNLVEHAIAETAHGYIELSAEAHAVDGQVLVRVRDTSDGASAQARRALLDDLLDQAAGAEAALDHLSPGLSLALAGRLARLLGVDIAVESGPGAGTTFELALPMGTARELERSPAPPLEAPAATKAVEPAAKAPVATTPAATTEPDTPVTSPAGTVLVIDDDGFERARVVSLLERAGYHVIPAASGHEGLAILRQEELDAVVLDLVMPGMTGLDVLRAARAQPRLAGVPFIVLSALFMTKSEREVLGPAVTAVVRKGEDTSSELVTQVHRAVRESAERREEIAPRQPLPPLADADRAHVLLVDADPASLTALERTLRGLPVSLDVAASGADAIERCRQRPPDLVVMDPALPGPGGTTAPSAIRALPGCQNVPIIALTPDSPSAEHRAHRVPEGESPYLAVPFQPPEIVAAVSRVLHLDGG